MLLTGLATILVVIQSLAAVTAGGIVMRHDRDERLFLEMALHYPSVVVLRRAESRSRRGDAGTLIAPRWILTAAHVAARLKAGDLADVGGGTRTIDLIICQPQWRTDADFKYDIALVRLTQPVRDIAPASIYDGSAELGMQVTFVGAGGHGTGLTGPIAEDGRVRAATNRVVEVRDSLLVFRFDAPGEADATELEGISGPGDSGGPAFSERNGRHFVIGVSSAQDSRPTGKRQGRYGVMEFYARVSAFATWIRRTIAEDSRQDRDNAAAGCLSSIP